MPGTQKIMMGRDRRQNKIDASNAMRQAGENAYIQGVQSAMDGGIGEAVRGDRTTYGNSNIPVNELIQGAGTFAYKDSPGNQATPQHQTGSVDTQVSSTIVPQQDPEEMETDALSNRLKMNEPQFGTTNIENRLYNMAKGGQGFPGLNNRNREV